MSRAGPRYSRTAVPMIVRTPSPALAPFVASLWHFEDAGELAHTRERILPSGAMQLLVNLHEDELRTYGSHGGPARRTRGATLAGAFVDHFEIDTAEQRAIVGVAFHPGGAYPFLKMPADDLHGSEAELGDVWGRDGAVLRERLLECASPQARLAVLDAMLLARAVHPLRRDPAMLRAIAGLERGEAVAAVGEGLGLSPRRLIDRFSAQVGMTPKRFARVRRFQRVLALLTSGRAPPWAELALQCGYYDQAHFIHEFTALSGLHPTAYAAREPGGHNHVVLA